MKKYKELEYNREPIPNDLKKFSTVADFPIIYLNVEENYNKMVLNIRFDKYK